MQPLNVFDYEPLAQARMEPGAWDYHAGGAGDELTVQENRAAFERIRLRPRVLVDVSTVDLRTTVLGTPVAMPILVAPSALQRLAHPESLSVRTHVCTSCELIMDCDENAARNIQWAGQSLRGVAAIAAASNRESAAL